mgnify:CR=1 FL=1
MPKIKPALNNLFCKKQKPEETTTAGIILPESSLEDTQFADVIAVGESVFAFKPEDVIVYKEYTTTDIKIDGDDYFLINQEDVLGTVSA